MSTLNGVGNFPSPELCTVAVLMLATQQVRRCDGVMFLRHSMKVSYEGRWVMSVGPVWRDINRLDYPTSEAFLCQENSASWQSDVGPLVGAGSAASRHQSTSTQAAAPIITNATPENWWGIQRMTSYETVQTERCCKSYYKWNSSLKDRSVRSAFSTDVASLSLYAPGSRQTFIL
jgi:hypothetical protein